MAKNDSAPTSRMKAIHQRFWAKVQIGGPDECWPWLGCKNRLGYGNVKWGASSQLAHRVAWMLWQGPIADGLCVLHRCDNPPCCNPFHLWTGTRADNNRDREEKGRAAHPKGSKNGLAKLTESESREIFSLRGKATQRVLGARFGVSKHAVWLIHNGKTWAHATGATSRA